MDSSVKKRHASRQVRSSPYAEGRRELRGAGQGVKCKIESTEKTVNGGGVCHGELRRTLLWVRG